MLIGEREYEKALHKVNKHITDLKRNAGAGKYSKMSQGKSKTHEPDPRQDIAQRLHLLVVKGKVFAAGGQPIKGLSITIRAASMAERYLLVSVLTEALLVLSVILNELSEFEASKDLCEAALPFVSYWWPSLGM